MFKLATTLTLAATAIAAPLSGLPVEVRQSSTVTDADILQYALTLEHLENAFYTKALQMWPETQFIAEGGSVSCSFYAIDGTLIFLLGRVVQQLEVYR